MIASSPEQADRFLRELAAADLITRVAALEAEILRLAKITQHALEDEATRRRALEERVAELEAALAEERRLRALLDVDQEALGLTLERVEGHLAELAPVSFTVSATNEPLIHPDDLATLVKSLTPREPAPEAPAIAEEPSRVLEVAAPLEEPSAPVAIAAAEKLPADPPAPPAPETPAPIAEDPKP